MQAPLRNNVGLFKNFPLILQVLLAAPCQSKLAFEIDLQAQTPFPKTLYFYANKTTAGCGDFLKCGHWKKGVLRPDLLGFLFYTKSSRYLQGLELVCSLLNC